MKRTLVLGGPGAGKTERMLRLVEEGLAAGLRPEDIAFVTFSNAAANEGRERAAQKFGLDAKSLRYFRTLHSLCFRELALSRGDVLQGDHLREIAELTGEDLTQAGADGTMPAVATKGDEMMFLDQYRRTTVRSLDQAWRDHGAEIDQFRLHRFVEAYSAFKRDLGLIDFTDMLEQYILAGQAVPVKLAIVDEAQDLTLLQWRVVDHAFENCSELWVAGDDDQAVHRWAGAATDHLLTLGYRQEVLPVSHRLPRTIFGLAAHIVERIARRYTKEWRASDREGEIIWIAGVEEVDLSAGTWLLLGRTRALLARLEDAARAQGVVYELKGRSSVNLKHVEAIQGYEALRSDKAIKGSSARRVFEALDRSPPYTLDPEATYDNEDLMLEFRAIWHDALVGIPLEDREYYLACLRRGEKLTADPRVRINTMHGAKGTEADNVVLLLDMSWRTHRGFELDADSEHRVFYVGATRARERLFLVESQNFYSYQI